MTNSTSQHYPHQTHHSSTLISHSSHFQPNQHQILDMENDSLMLQQQQSYSHSNFLHHNQEINLQTNNNFIPELSAYIPFMNGENGNWSSSGTYSPTMLAAAAAAVSSNDSTQASCSSIQICYGTPPQSSHYTSLGVHPQDHHSTLSPTSSVMTPSWTTTVISSTKKNSNYDSMPKSPQQQYKWMQVKRVIAKPVCKFILSH